MAKGVQTQVEALGGATCGAKTRGGKLCRQPAGFGTPHYGIGKCKFHGGSTPNQVKSAATTEYRRLLGNPIEINPLDAILKCIAIRHGEIVWLSDRMAELDEKDFTHDTIVGEQFHLYVKERHHAMQDLVRFSQIAVSLGIAERAVKLAETYGELLANLVSGILQDLWPHLDEVGRKNAPALVRRRLIALDAGGADRAALPPAAAA